MPILDQILTSISNDLFPEVAELYSIFKGKQTSQKPPYFDTSWDNERFYQYICLKALNRNFQHYVVADKLFNNKEIDLTMIIDGKIDVVIEMKRWFTKNGKKEIGNFIRDIESLKTHAVNHRIFLITTIHPTNQRDENIDILCKDLNISKETMKTASIPLDSEITFEIICFPI